MPLGAGDIVLRLSGGAANTNPAASLGGAMSSTAAGTQLFDDIDRGEASTGESEYRCVYLYNAHATYSLTNAVVWIQVQTPSPDTTVAIALGGEGLNGTAETIADENTAPSGESFSAPANQGAGLSIGTLAPGARYPIWIRRTVSAGAAAASDNFRLRVGGDSPA